jgi:hypothetical protein
MISVLARERERESLERLRETKARTQGLQPRKNLYKKIENSSS